jgi:hypothetical protein
MSNEENLRALLREAQEDGMSPDLYERIDAALAEPVSDTFGVAVGMFARQAERAEKAERERDEARAEVERLRGIAMHPTGVTWERHHENLKQIALEEVYAAHAALDDAYQRGAEAMREKAANAIPGHYSGDIIRALPLPEEAP